MEENLDRPLEAGELSRVASGLARVATFVPDARWNDGAQGWATLAEAGVKAAKSGDRALIDATCKACHKAWRRNYKADFRRRALPSSD
jgi:cytochrome c553